VSLGPEISTALMSNEREERTGSQCKTTDVRSTDQPGNHTMPGHRRPGSVHSHACLLRPDTIHLHHNQQSRLVDNHQPHHTALPEVQLLHHHHHHIYILYFISQECSTIHNTQ